MSKGRDNFSVSVVRMMRDRVAGRCSNPDCRVVTLAPSGKEKLNNTGIAAHIHAAAKGGPRYDASMSKEERKSIHNGIWLCSNCSIKIDRDIDAYPVEALHNWKNKAEEKALSELGKKLPDNNDAIDTLTAAFTGTSRNFLSQSIDNVHKAHDQSLECLDSRFSITTEYINKCSIVKLRPKEDVPFMISIMPEAKEDFVNGHNDLVKHGRDLIISNDLFQIKGSKLIEYITDSYLSQGRLTISSKKIPAIKKVWVINKKTGVHTYLDDIHGYLILGTETFTFIGTALNHILRFESTFKVGSNNYQTKLSLDFSVWNNKPLINLSFFKKIFNFYKEVSEGGVIHTTLDVDGEQQVSGMVKSADSVDLSYQVFDQLKYIEYERVISSYTNKEINFFENTMYDYEHFNFVEDIYKTIKGENKWTAERQTKNAESDAYINSVENFNKIIINSNEECEIKIKDNTHETVEIFGIEINLPSKVVYMQGTIVKIIKGTVEDVKKKQVIKLEYVPTENYICSILYEA